MGEKKTQTDNSQVISKGAIKGVDETKCGTDRLKKQRASKTDRTGNTDGNGPPKHPQLGNSEDYSGQEALR